MRLIFKNRVVMFCTVFVTAMNMVWANDVMFINKSLRNSVEVNYQYCSRDSQVPSKGNCGAINSINVKHGSHEVVKSEENAAWISVISAVGKDGAGRVISQSKYSYIVNEFTYSHCGYPLQMNTFQNNVTIILDDVNELPVIVCDAHGYIQ